MNNAACSTVFMLSEKSISNPTMTSSRYWKYTCFHTIIATGKQRECCEYRKSIKIIKIFTSHYDQHNDCSFSHTILEEKIFRSWWKQNRKSLHRFSLVEDFVACRLVNRISKVHNRSEILCFLIYFFVYLVVSSSI